MRFGAVSLLWASIVPATLAIFADEAYQIDYHHALLGTPQADTTFFHRPSISSGASLLYTLSEKLILGAVNPKNGSVVWRQDLSDDTTGLTSDAFLRAADGDDAVVSALGNDVSSWGAVDGRLSWTNPIADGPVRDLALAETQGDNPGEVSRDTIVLSGDNKGVVRRLDGKIGNVKWEYRDDSDDIPFRVSISANTVHYITLQSASRKGYKIKVSELNSETGQLGQEYLLHTENEVSTPDSIIFVGENAAAPLIAWTDNAFSLLKINVIGSKAIHSVNIENASGDELQQIQIHVSRQLNMPPQFLIHYGSVSGSWADVYDFNSKSMAISKSYTIPKIPGRSAFTASTRDSILYFTRITDSEISIYSSSSDVALGKWAPSDLGVKNAQHASSEVVARGSTVAVRFAMVEESGDWVLVRNGQVEWSRPESLADATIATWADVNGGEALAHELELEGHQNVYMAYIHRLSRHVKDLQEHLPTWLKELPLRILTSFLPNGATELTEFGFGKHIIIATRKGRIISLDSGNQGNILWNIKAAERFESNWNVKTITVEHGIASLYINDGSSMKLNTSTGEITERTPPTTKLASIVSIPDATSARIVGVEADGGPIQANANGENEIVVTLSEDGRALGWSADNTKTPAWEFLPPKGQKITHATARPSHDPVASIGKVLGDRSVLYKYINPSVALFTAVTDSTVTFYLIDGVSGQILHTVTQSNVDTSQPIASVMSENWFAYSFWADESETSDAKGYQLVVSELYESPLPNDRGVLGDSANYSSIHSSIGVPRPHVITQAYKIPESISNMAVTQTRQGITIKQLLCTLPSSNAIIGIPRPALDPRRPVGRDPTSKEAAEGLARYNPVLDFDPKWYLTHNREVMGIQHIESSPTLLESSTLIFSYGFDIFGTRLAPSQPFDILGKGFSKIQLLLTVVALAAGVSALAPMVRSKQVNSKWKSS